MSLNAEFSRFPKDWTVFPFLDVFEDVTSKGIKVKKENYDPSGVLPVVDQGKSLFGGRTDIANKVVGVDLPAIVFGDHTKVFKLIDEEFAVGADGVKLLAPKVDADKKFLFFYINQLELEDAGYSRHFKFLKETYIPLPPLETQKQIAAVLEKADQLRKDCQQMEQELNSLAQSVFIDMFGDPVTNPKGWEVKSLLDVCTKVTDGTHQSPEWADSGVPFLFISNVRDGKVNFDTGKYITERCYKELTRTSPIEVNDILYTTVGSYGHVAMVRDDYPEFCFQRHIAHIKPDAEKINPQFLYYQLQTSGVKHLADIAVKGIAQKTLNLKDLKAFKILIPPLSKQLELVAFMKANIDVTRSLENTDNEYGTLFSSLMQKAFKGELNLKPSKTKAA